MSTRRHRPREPQLELPFAEPEPKELPSLVDAGSLVALHSAVRLVLAVAEGQVAPSAVALQGLDASLSVLAEHDPGGRLGHVVRRYRAQPATAARWRELVDELAFVLTLTPTSGVPEQH